MIESSRSLKPQGRSGSSRALEGWQPPKFNDNSISTPTAVSHTWRKRRGAKVLTSSRLCKKVRDGLWVHLSMKVRDVVLCSGPDENLGMDALSFE